MKKGFINAFLYSLYGKIKAHNTNSKRVITLKEIANYNENDQTAVTKNNIV